jgi:hypothetical protein
MSRGQLNIGSALFGSENLGHERPNTSICSITKERNCAEEETISKVFTSGTGRSHAQGPICDHPPMHELTFCTRRNSAIADDCNEPRDGTQATVIEFRCSTPTAWGP